MLFTLIFDSFIYKDEYSKIRYIGDISEIDILGSILLTELNLYILKKNNKLRI